MSTSRPVTFPDPVAAKKTPPKFEGMLSEKETRNLRRFVCGQLRDEPDLRYRWSLQGLFYKELFE